MTHKEAVEVKSAFDRGYQDKLRAIKKGFTAQCPYHKDSKLAKYWIEGCDAAMDQVFSD